MPVNFLNHNATPHDTTHDTPYFRHKTVIISSFYRREIAKTPLEKVKVLICV